MGRWKARRVPKSLGLAIGFNLMVTLSLLPVAGQAYDLAGLTGATAAWLRWGTPLFYHWKFGADMTAISLGAQGSAFILAHLGMGGAAAITSAWKLPLVAANIGTGLVLYDIGKRLRSGRATVIPVLWLASPVPIFVAAGFGQVEPLTVLAFVLATDLVLRHRLLASGVVIGLGIGIEYLPVLMVVAVVSAEGCGLVNKRGALYTCATATCTAAACFLPLLLTGIGRSSLFGGLVSSAAVTPAVSNGVAGARSSSVWTLLGDVSPGRYWVVAAAVLCVGIGTALALYGGRHCEQQERDRRFVAASAATLLVVVLLDPTPLPQFSDLVFGALCLLAVGVAIPAWTLVVGPFLQLLVGIVWVYSGTFESFWYDMWATTGNQGWQLPQSAAVATWLGIAGIVTIVIGLILARADVGGAMAGRLPVLALVVACGGSLFFGVWSAQPAYWQGVGRSGPHALPDFKSFTAMQPGSTASSGQGTLVSFPGELVREVTHTAQKPTVVLGVQMPVVYGPSGVGYPVLVKDAPRVVVTLASDPSRARSLWVNVLVGRRSWTGFPADVQRKVPMLVAGRYRVEAEDIHWVAPGWCVASYALPVAATTGTRTLAFSLYGGEAGTYWNGATAAPWATVGVRSATAQVIVNAGRVLKGQLTFPSLSGGLAGSEQGILTGLPYHPSFTVTHVSIGKQTVAVTSAAVTWPLSAPLDGRVGAPLLLAMGAADLAVLLLGFLLLMGWCGPLDGPPLHHDT